MGRFKRSVREHEHRQRSASTFAAAHVKLGAWGWFRARAAATRPASGAPCAAFPARRPPRTTRTDSAKPVSCTSGPYYLTAGVGVDHLDRYSRGSWYDRRTGSMRPLCGPSGRRGPGAKQQRYKHRLPRGIYINHDDLVAMATGPQPGDGALPAQSGLLNQGEAMLKAMDREIISLKRQVQQNKQQLSALKRKVGDTSVEDLRPGEPPAKINSRWTNDELLMAVTAVRKYGKDFQAIAETLGTKTEAHVRNFFVSYRRRYNLDAVVREHEAERGAANHVDAGTTSTDANDNSTETNGATASPQNSKEEKMEVDSEGVALGAPAEQGGAPTTPPKPKGAK
ncbi:REST corepressor 3 [Eumeta japonica]|uniref:REST corepressor 3 n=1 Tax=Eumeta variegata TaxID=151549 RepID=A0A4C1ZSK5_EUMVA|nr:REST corepressor 3 [Eumeta japonica]